MKKIKLLSSIIVSNSLLVGAIPFMANCNNKTGEKAYRLSKVNSNLFFADDIQKFVDKVDADYGYNFAYELSYNKDLSQWLGWRNAGSDAEHKCAEFIAKEMQAIGLKDVAIEQVPCDSFNFKNSYLKIGNETICYPASYQVNGTGYWKLTGDASERDAEFVPVEYDYPIVDLGNGFESAYINRDLPSKYIALVGVDQSNIMWIDSYMRQAKSHKGCKGLITYSVGGYGEINKDSINVQDVCGGFKLDEECFPVVAISYNQAQQIKQHMASGIVSNCHLLVDAYVLRESDIKEYGLKSSYTPYTCDVIGRIPGKDRGKQIVLGGHYDKYWYGFHDNSTAISLTMAIAKAMIEIGYQPDCDIVICSTGAEEWARADSNFDWTGGAWGILEKKDNFTSELNRNFADKTIAILNCEMPAFKTEFTKSNCIRLDGCPEMLTIINDFVTKMGLCVTSGNVGVWENGHISKVTDDSISYRCHGVPNLINSYSPKDFLYTRYHTNFDDVSVYDKDIFKTNLNWFGAMTMYLDKTPALPLDFGQTAKLLANEFSKEAALGSKVDESLVNQYIGLLDKIASSSEVLNTTIKEINTQYNEAVIAKDATKIAELKDKANKVNEITKTVFKYINALDYSSTDPQSTLLMTNTDDCFWGHQTYKNNYFSLTQALADAKNKSLDVLEDISITNAGRNLAYTIFSKEAATAYKDRFDQEYFEHTKRTKDEMMWGWNRQTNNVTGTKSGMGVNTLGDAVYDIAIANVKGETISDSLWTNLVKELEAGILQNNKFYSDRISEEITILTKIATALSI